MPAMKGPLQFPVCKYSSVFLWLAGKMKLNCIRQGWLKVHGIKAACLHQELLGTGGFLVLFRCSKALTA